MPNVKTDTEDITMIKNDDSPIVFYQYFDTTDTGFFQKKVLERFRATGHDRPVEFRVWNCYNDQPGTDGDLFSYDCICLNALSDKGYLRQLPEIIGTDGIFQWMLDTTRYKRNLYSLPFLTCYNAVICRKKDFHGINNVYDIKGKIVTPLRSMLAYYYLISFAGYQGEKFDPVTLSKNAVGVIEMLARLMGGKQEVERSAFGTFDGAEKFNSGEADYFIGFTENLRNLKKDDYCVIPANFSDKKQIDVPLFSTDVLSVGKNTEAEKLLDCIDLIEIMTDPEFEYSICAPDGNLSYMLPANEASYKKLIEKDTVYKTLFDTVSREDNCVFRFSKDYYELLPKLENSLMDALKS